MMVTQVATQINGVNVDQLVGTVQAIQENPDIAKFQFRATNSWVNGGHSRTSIQGFYGAGSEDSSRIEPFVLDGDEPPVLLGNNAGPNAVEVFLHALASCLSVGFIYNAAAKGIRIDALSFDMEGNIDLRAFLGLTDEVRPGYSDISVTVRAESDASYEALEELSSYVQETSPVLDMIRNPVPVSIEMVQ
jgi:uncharacterized OsmC-like protein